jgi:hypothetical protein
VLLQQATMTLEIMQWAACAYQNCITGFKHFSIRHSLVWNWTFTYPFELTSLIEVVIVGIITRLDMVPEVTFTNFIKSRIVSENFTEKLQFWKKIGYFNHPILGLVDKMLKSWVLGLVAEGWGFQSVREQWWYVLPLIDNQLMWLGMWFSSKNIMH